MTSIHLAGLVVVAIVAFALLHRLAWFAWTFADRTARRASPYLRGWGAMAYAHPLRTAFAARWPRLYAVLARRVNPHSFAGLPLTLMAIAALYVFGLFGGLIEDLLQREGIILFDADINGLFAAYRVTPLLEAFLWLTAFGSSPAIVAVGVVATGFLWSHSRSFLVAPLWITVLGAQATTWAGKYVIGRERAGLHRGRECRGTFVSERARDRGDGCLWISRLRDRTRASNGTRALRAGLLDSHNDHVDRLQPDLPRRALHERRGGRIPRWNVLAARRHRRR
jgi:hypothetical protein